MTELYFLSAEDEKKKNVCAVLRPGRYVERNEWGNP